MLLVVNLSLHEHCVDLGCVPHASTITCHQMQPHALLYTHLLGGGAIVKLIAMHTKIPLYV